MSALGGPAGAARTFAAGVSDAVFVRFQALVHRESGIWLSPAKKALLVGRLSKRLRALGLASLREYYELVRTDEGERTHMLDCLTTNETRFFRDARQFELLAERVYPAWQAEAAAGRRPRRIRAWSAACSTGEEPYSLALSLRRAFPPGLGWTIEILATDLSTRVLELARRATWSISRSGEIPDPLLRRFMLRGTGREEGRMKAGPEIEPLVRFARLNLNDEAYPGLGAFDLVFCRNVLIYFDAPTKVRVLERLARHLAPTGLLFLGHAESVGGASGLLRAVAPSVYALAGGPSPARLAGSARG